MTRPEMLEIMTRLDERANALLLAGASDIDLLAGMFDLMPDFKALLDSRHHGKVEANAAIQVPRRSASCPASGAREAVSRCFLEKSREA